MYNNYNKEPEKRNLPILIKIYFQYYGIDSSSEFQVILTLPDSHETLQSHISASFLLLFAFYFVALE